MYVNVLLLPSTLCLNLSAFVAPLPLNIIECIWNPVSNGAFDTALPLANNILYPYDPLIINE